MMSDFKAGSLYGMDKIRVELHQELCARYEMSAEETKKITDHLNLYKTGYDMHMALVELKDGGDFTRFQNAPE